jgi:hypothetical protein
MKRFIILLIGIIISTNSFALSAIIADTTHKAIIKDSVLVKKDTTLAKKDTAIVKKWTDKSSVILSTEQLQQDNWAAGGYSSFSFSTFFKGFYNYKYNKHKLDNSIEMSYGRTRQDVTGKGISDKSNKWIKSEDKIELNSIYGYSAINRWNYSALLNLKTQFDNGYKNDTLLISSGLSPAVLTSSVGLEFKTKNFSTLFSCLTGKTTYCLDKRLRKKGNFSFQEDDKAWDFSLGSFIKVFYQKDIFKNVNVLFKLDFFYDYEKKSLLDTDITNEIFINMKVNKFLTAFIDLQATIDKDFSTKLQYKERMGISIPLTF